MSDARWFEVEFDIDSAVTHFGRSVDLYRKGGFKAPDLAGYQAAMALMHAVQSGHTSLEGGLLRILEMLGEERPGGDNWDADLIKRVSSALPGRPPILNARLAAAADETRRFRHRATHTYDSFQVHEAARTIRAAEILAAGLKAAILSFGDVIDPSPGAGKP